MKTFSTGLLLCGAFILGCAAAHVSQTLTVPPAHAEAGGPRWESLCVDAPGAGVVSPEWDERLAAANGWNAAMNRYGAEGWEPFQVHAYPNNNEIQFVCFRRPR